MAYNLHTCHTRHIGYRDYTHVLLLCTIYSQSATTS